MDIVTSLSKKELEQIISEQVTKCLEAKLSPRLELPDRIGLDDAVIITGLSKATLYKLTHEKKLPHMKFGSRLVFSRRQLAAWVEDRTLPPPSSPEDEIKASLIKSAEKKLRDAK